MTTRRMFNILVVFFSTLVIPLGQYKSAGAGLKEHKIKKMKKFYPEATPDRVNVSKVPGSCLKKLRDVNPHTYKRFPQKCYFLDSAVGSKILCFVHHQNAIS